METPVFFDRAILAQRSVHFERAILLLQRITLLTSSRHPNPPRILRSKRNQSYCCSIDDALWSTMLCGPPQGKGALP